ncbi:hypothetical protein BJX64DRAFT_265939 [Aspergillus heterothallicus]
MANTSTIHHYYPPQSSQPHAPIMHLPNTTAMSQALHPSQLSQYTLLEPTPTPSFHCRWEGCQSQTAFKRLPDIIRHLKEIHLAPAAYPCPVEGCSRTFNELIVYNTMNEIITLILRLLSKDHSFRLYFRLHTFFSARTVQEPFMR